MSLPPINRLKVLVTGQRGGITSDLIALRDQITAALSSVSGQAVQADRIAAQTAAQQTANDRIATAASRTAADGDASVVHADRLIVEAADQRTVSNAAAAQAAATALNTGAITQAVADARTAKAGAETAQSGAAGSASSASQIKADLLALAGSSGIPFAYTTKAQALAASYPGDGKLVFVGRDESAAGHRTIYVTSGGVLGTAIDLDAKSYTLYVDSIRGSDANDGLTQETAVKSLVKMQTLLNPFVRTVGLACGSIWYGENPTFASTTYRPDIYSYGNGAKPIITCRRPVTSYSGGWTQPVAGAGRAWKKTFTLLNGVLNASSAAWFAAMYWEQSSKRIEDSGITRHFSETSIAANVAWIEANPGTQGAFTANLIGRTEPDPTSAYGGTITATGADVYVVLPNGVDPNTVNLSIVDQNYAATVGYAQTITAIRFECTGSKDFVNTIDSPKAAKAGLLTDVEVAEAASHAGVWGGVNTLRHRARSAYWLPGGRTGGGGLHQYRSVLGSSDPAFPNHDQPGSSYYHVEPDIEGFGIAFYAHGAGYNGPIYDKFDVFRPRVRNCSTAFDTGGTARGVNVHNPDIKNVGQVSTDTSSFTFYDGTIVMGVVSGTSAPFVFYGNNPTINLRGTELYCNSSCSLGILGGGDPGVGLRPLIKLRKGASGRSAKCINTGANGWGLGLAIGIDVGAGCIISKFSTGDLSNGVPAFYGPITVAAGGVFEYPGMTPVGMQAIYGSTFDLGAITGTTYQTLNLTVGASTGNGSIGPDLAWYPITGQWTIIFNASTGVVGDGTLTFSRNPNSNAPVGIKGLLRVDNALGAGVPGYFFVNSASGNNINVTPRYGTTVGAVVSFNSTYAVAGTNYAAGAPFTANLSGPASTTLTLPANKVGYMSVGTRFKVSNVGGDGRDYGWFQIVSYSGNNATMDRFVMFGPNINAGLPNTCTISFDQYILDRTVAPIGPKATITKVDGTVIALTGRTGTFGDPNAATPGALMLAGSLAADDGYGGRPLKEERGTIPNAFTLAPGDQLALEFTSVLLQMSIMDALANDPMVDGFAVFRKSSPITRMLLA